jgi:hypothetical protein
MPASLLVRRSKFSSRACLGVGGLRGMVWKDKDGHQGRVWECFYSVSHMSDRQGEISDCRCPYQSCHKGGSCSAGRWEEQGVEA